jgi:hypothetical protein
VYGRTDDAISTTIGAKEPVGKGNGNTHRARLQAELQSASVSLMDTYERDYSQSRRAAGGCPLTNRFQPPTHTATRSSAPPTPRKATEKSKKDRGKATQSRPWPPPGLAGTPLVTIQPSPSPAVKPSKPKTAPSVSAPVDTLLADPKFFMSVANALTTPKPTTPAQVKPPTSAQAKSSTPAEAKSSPSTRVKPSPTAQGATKPSPPTSVFTAQETIKQALSASANHNEIRKIPVEEFSFPLSNALAPGEVSTHTDGAPSPATLSGFSDQASVTSNRIRPSASPSGIRSPVPPNIMDSPILDDVSDIAVMKGQEWVLNSQFIALQAEFDAMKKELAEVKQSLATVADTPQTSVAIPDTKAGLPNPGPDLKDGRQIQSKGHSASTSIYARPSSPAKSIGLGISNAPLDTALKPFAKSPELVPAALQPRSTNGSIFGDSKVFRNGSKHAATASSDLLSLPTGRPKPKRLTRGPAGAGMAWLLEHLGTLSVGADPAPTPSGLEFVNKGPAQKGFDESDDEL